MLKFSTLLKIGIAFIQMFDIFIHAVTNQLEVIRVVPNLIILLWLGISTLGKFNNKFSSITIGIYLLLNIIFLVQNGLTNPQQGGELRVMLFILVFLTTALSVILAYTRNKQVRN